MNLVAWTKKQYKKELRETVYVRRLANYGDSPPHQDYSARARVTRHAPQELVGAVQQFELLAIVYADDLTEGGLTLPITNRDKLVVGSRVHGIVSADDNTRKVYGTLIAFEIRASG